MSGLTHKIDVNHSNELHLFHYGGRRFNKNSCLPDTFLSSRFEHIHKAHRTRLAQGINFNKCCSRRSVGHIIMNTTKKIILTNFFINTAHFIKEETSNYL